MRPIRGRLGAVLAASLAMGWALAGCAPTPLVGTPAYRPAPRPSTPRPAPRPSPVSSLANLPGWAEEDHAAALAAFQSGCGVATGAEMHAVCLEARALGPAPDPAARAFLETHFRPVILSGPGLLTAYFSPEYPARDTPDPVFSAAVRPRPADMVYSPAGPGAASSRPAPLQRSDDGRTWPYPTRAGIELTPPTDALAYVRPEDLFFLQVQGSGTLVFPDGRRLKATYAADNGRPFAPIASQMVARGYLQPDHASATAIRAWLHAHAGADAQGVMDLNPRYVFFSLQPDDGRDPAGAASVPLTAGRTIAVDPSWHSYGEPYWVDAAAPTLAGAVKTYRRLVMALDTGSAIRGDVRADLYLGRGERAGLEAGRVRHTLLLVKLEPIPGETAGRAVQSLGPSHEAIAPAGGN